MLYFDEFSVSDIQLFWVKIEKYVGDYQKMVYYFNQYHLFYETMS